MSARIPFSYFSINRWRVAGEFKEESQRPRWGEELFSFYRKGTLSLEGSPESREIQLINKVNTVRGIDRAISVAAARRTRALTRTRVSYRGDLSLDAGVVHAMLIPSKTSAFLRRNCRYVYYRQHETSIISFAVQFSHLFLNFFFFFLFLPPTSRLETLKCSKRVSIDQYLLWHVNNYCSVVNIDLNRDCRILRFVILKIYHIQSYII